MSREATGSLLAAMLVFGGTSAMARPHHLPDAPGTLVGVSVALDGRAASLYPAPDGSGRYYLEARAGSRYSVSLANRTGERLGVVLSVDGLNAVSGERETQRGRMYVLDPWQTTSVQGWRTSLSDIRQFTFVDERRSYAARSGQANQKMGWIEVAVYRERHALVKLREYPYSEPKRQDSAERQEGDGRNQAPAAPAPEAGASRDTAHAPLLSRHGLGRPRARPGRARQLRPRTEPERARHAALRVPLGSRRARRAPHARAAARSAVAARTRRARLRAAPALVAGGSRARRGPSPPLLLKGDA